MSNEEGGDKIRQGTRMWATGELINVLCRLLSISPPAAVNEIMDVW